MAFTYGTPITLKPEEEKQDKGLTYGEPKPLVFGDYAKAEYGEPVSIAKLDPKTPPGERSMIVKRPDLEDIEELRSRYADDGVKPLTSTATGGGPLGLPSPGEVMERKYPGARAKMDALEEAAWEGEDESGWAEVFGNTLRNTLPKFRRQIVGGMRAGNPVTVQDLQLNADIELGQPGAGTGNIAQSIQNAQIAKEWGFEEGSEKVPPGANPVQAFADWLQTEEGRAEVEAEAAETPVAMIAQDIWDAETGKIRENEVKVKPQSPKYYAAGILDAGINMGPAMAATIVTRNPNVGATIMGGQVYGDTYGEMLDRGYSPDQAMSAALFSSAAETLTERIPLGVLTSGKYTGLKRILAGASAEGIQEPVTEALQMGYDIGILNDEITMGEAMWRLIDAGIIGFGVGGGMGAGVEVLNQVSTPAAKEVAEEDQELETIVAHVNVRAGEEEQLTQLEESVQQLDSVVNEAAADLDEDQLTELESEGLIKVRENGTVQVLPKGRRRFNQEQRKLEQARIEQEAKRQGMDDAEASVVAAAAQTQAEPAIAEELLRDEPVVEAAPPSALDDAAIEEPSVDGVLTDTELFGDSANAESIRVEGFNNLDRERQHMVLSQVRSALNNKQILKSVVETVPIDVMNDLVGQESTTDSLLDDPSVLTNRLSIASEEAISEPVISFVNSLASTVEAASTESVAEEAGLPPAGIPVTPDVVAAEGADVDVSPQIDIDIGPTEAQKKAGNYPKGVAKVQGLDISIENPVGSVRRGTDRNGKEWKSTLQHHYGYIKGTVGKDKDHLDVFIGPTPSSEQVYVINQRKNPKQPLTEKNFDEHKIMIGFESADAARDGYLANYESGWKGMGSMVPITMDSLKSWMKSGNTKKIFRPRGVERLFSTEEKGRLGISVESLNAIVQEAQELYPNAPNVQVMRDESQLPRKQRIAIQHAGLKGKISGLFDPDTGTVFLVASNIPSRKKALEVFLHESVGHYGLRSVLGAEYDMIMDEISKVYPAQVQDAARRNGLNPMNMYQRRLAAEEFIAYRAQQVLTGVKIPVRQMSLLQRVMKALRIALARLRGLRVSDNDILKLIRKARIFVATPNAKGSGMLRTRQPPVLYSGLWLALNQDRVPMSGRSVDYYNELLAQHRAGNLDAEGYEFLLDWLDEQTPLDVTNLPSGGVVIDKADLMEKVRELGNTQAFHVEQYDGRREAIENGDLYEGFTIPEGSRTSQAWNYLVFKAQDKFIDLLNVQEAIEQQSGRKLDDQIDAYLSEELFHGKVKSRIDRFDKEYIKPLIDAIEASDYTWDEVEWYLYARHAPEANKRLYEINRSGAIKQRRERTKQKAKEKFDNRMTRIGQTRARARNKVEAEHAATLRVIESEYRSQMRRSRPTQVARRQDIEEAKRRKVERADALKTKRIDEAESKYRLVRDDYDLTYRVEIEEADTQFREQEQARVGEDPGLLALSGMSDADAALAMETLRDKGSISDMEKTAVQIDRMTARNREIMVDEGLEEQSTIDAWEAAYDYYVPLKGFKDGPMNTTFFPKKGKGYDTGGKLQKLRLGRRSIAANILANVVAQHQSAVIMAEKADVGRTLLKMVQEHPNPDLWTANEIETKKRLDPKTGLVATAIDPIYKLKDNVLRVKVDGKDYHITFNENNAAAMRIASSMKNLSAQEINIFFQSLLGLNRILSAVNTSYNPEFVVSNLTRDLQTAMINLNATDANQMKMAILKDVFKAHRGIRRFLDLPSGRDKAKADYWKEQFEIYRDLGGQVGWLDNYRDVKDLEASLYREMHDRSTGMVSFATLRKMATYIESENQAIENAVRLSAFVHARNAGMSGPRAASLAKNLTVNFNRKGDMGTVMNALYLFYNASIQGMAIMWKAAKSPKVRKVMYGIVAFAAALEIMNRMIAGDDDDGENRYEKIPIWVKERNMIVMLPDQYQTKDPESFNDYYITIPLPYGYNMLHVVGQKIGGIIDYTGIGNKREWKPMEDAFEIISAALGSFNPIGTGPTPLQTFLPTFLQPLTQSSENVAWHGGPIVPPLDAHDPAPPPESQQFYRSVPEHAKALAEFLNKLGGGSKARPADFSFMDISPETIQLWEDFLTGGAGRFISNMVELGVMVKNDAIDIRKVPFARRFVGLTDERAVSDRFYQSVEEISYAVQEIKVSGEQVGLAATKEERAEAMEDRARVVEQYQADAALEDALKQIQNHLRTLNAQRKAVNNSKRDDEWKEEKVEKIELKKTQLMNKFNKKYNEIRDKRRNQQEQARIDPQLSGSERLAAVKDFNQAGYPAMASLIKSLPTNPSSDFVEKLNA